MEGQSSIKLIYTYHLNLLASHSGSSNVKVSLVHWLLYIVYGGAVTVIQEVDANLHTPLLVPDTPAPFAALPARVLCRAVQLLKLFSLIANMSRGKFTACM